GGRSSSICHTKQNADPHVTAEGDARSVPCCLAGGTRTAGSGFGEKCALELDSQALTHALGSSAVGVQVIGQQRYVLGPEDVQAAQVGDVAVAPRSQAFHDVSQRIAHERQREAGCAGGYL